jgi:protein tyrosine phosphatase (PTP) superfamily phosphohydrolase (DUF442 family)
MKAINRQHCTREIIRGYLLGACLASALSSQPVSADALSIATEDLPNYHVVCPAVVRGGQPSLKGLERLHKDGIKTVISFRHNKSVTETETAEAQKLNLKFYSMPISGTHSPSPAFIKRFLSIATDPEAQPVFVHCEEGVDRTGSMIAIYRIEVQNWSADQAYREMHSYGCHTRYPWLADAVFDWAEQKGLSSKGRPLSVKIFDSFDWIFELLRFK